MSGPSSQQLQLQDEQMQFYQQGQQESQTAFSEQQDLLKQMEQVYSPILAKGPNQEGFSGEEKRLTRRSSATIRSTTRPHTNFGSALGC